MGTMDSIQPVKEKSKKRKCFEIFISYLKSMLFAFTGGIVGLPILQEQLDDKYHLMKKERVLECFSLGQILPGVISLNSGILVGREIAGAWGVVAAIAGNVFPAFFGMLLVAVFFSFLSTQGFITSAIDGIRVASIAVILANAVGIVKSNVNKITLLLFGVAFISTFVFKLNILLVMLVCGVAGIFLLPDEKKKEEKLK